MFYCLCSVEHVVFELVSCGFVGLFSCTNFIVDENMILGYCLAT